MKSVCLYQDENVRGGRGNKRRMGASRFKNWIIPKRGVQKDDRRGFEGGTQRLGL